MPHNDPTKTAAHPAGGADPSPTVTGGGPDAAATPGRVWRENDVAAPPASGSRYVLGEEIARGGMGEVYRTTDTVLNREVAVKVLQAKYGPGSGSAHRFADEARITGQLQHPAIPPVHDLGTLPDGRPFLAMKLIKGQTLDDLLKARPDPSVDRGRFVVVFEAVCQAVAYAHAHDVIHRDLKPANVMVGAFAEVQVMDWGLAKVLSNRGSPAADPNETVGGTEVVSLRDSDGSFTQAGSVLGTPAFMPPEQAIGAVASIDRRSDVFGLGAILAVILTGRPPFVASTAETTRVKAAQGDVTECFAELDTCGAEPELVALCKRCLAPKQDDRPSNATEVATAVAEHRAAAAERARQAELDGLKASEQRRRRRTQFVLAAVAVGMLAASGFGVTVATLWRQAERAKDDAVQSRDDAETARRDTEAARERLARVEYGRTIQVAYQEFRENNVGAARKLLESTRPDLRGWEYHHVHRLCGEELFTISPWGEMAIEDWRFGSAVSPDRLRYATSKPDNTVGVWDLESGAEVLTLKGHTGKVEYVAYCRDGSRLLTEGADNAVKVWDTSSGKELCAIRWPYTRYISSELSPDGKRIVTRAADKTAKVWDVETGAELFTVDGHTAELILPVFSPDGTRLLTGAEGQVAKVRDASTGKVIATIRGLPFDKLYDTANEVYPACLADFSPDGSAIYISIGGRSIAKVWDAGTGIEKYTLRDSAFLPCSWPARSSFSTNGNRLATISYEDNVVSLREPISGKEQTRLVGHTSDVFQAQFDSKGRWFATCSRDGTAKIWDARTGVERKSLRGHSGTVQSVAFSPDETKLVTGGLDGTARLWDVATGAELRVFRGHGREVDDAWFSPDGAKVITRGGDGTVKVWDTRSDSNEIHFSKAVIAWFSSDWTKYLEAEGRTPPRVRDVRTGAVICTLKGADGVVDFADFSRDGSRVIVSGATTSAGVWDATTGAKIRGFGPAASGVSSTLSEDGSRIAGADWSGNKVTVWDTNSGEELLVLRHPDHVSTATFSPDGARIATGCYDGTVRVWDAVAGKELLTLKGTPATTVYPRYSRDGKHIVMAGQDTTVRLWDANSGGELMVFRGHTRYVMDADLSPDGTRVLSASGDGTAKVWDAKSGIELLSLRTHAEPWRVSFSTDGKRILCVGRQQAVIWDSRPYRETRFEQQATREPGKK